MCYVTCCIVSHVAGPDGPGRACDSEGLEECDRARGTWLAAEDCSTRDGYGTYPLCLSPCKSLNLLITIDCFRRYVSQ